MGAGAFERFASDFNSRGVARSGGGGGTAGVLDGGLGLGLGGCDGGFVYEVGAVKYATSAYGNAERLSTR